MKLLTITIPCYNSEKYMPVSYTHLDILHVSMTEWENYAENDMVYQERALGQVKSEMEIIDRIISVIPFQVNDIQKKKILSAREKRMKNALHNVPEDLIDVLKILKNRKIKIGLISNADIIDLSLIHIFGCGVPVGAFLMTEKVGAHSLASGDHGTTYG